jgi:hypothetical protein
LVAAGGIVLLWGQKARLVGLLAKLRPAQPTVDDLGPAERFERLYALRVWCEKAGHAEAVKSLDAVVLPSIVRDSGAVEGGFKS